MPISMPKASVLMSVYNKGQFLRETVQTVLNQTYSDFEFIIRDNGSTDDSVDIISSFDDPRIRFARNSRNLGPVGSMNNCIEAARGEYLVFFHGDDLWERNFLEISVDFLDRFETIALCHSLMHAVDDFGNTSLSRTNNNIGEYEVTTHQEALKRLFKSCYIKTPTVVYRKTAMRYYDFRYVYVCDWDIYLQMAAAQGDFLFINQPLMYYRTTDGSETSIGVRGGNLIIESYLMLRNFFSQHPEYCMFRRKAFRRLSESTLRRSRTVDCRERAYFLLRCVILFYPLKVFSPIDRKSVV